jgi:phosphatidylinositol-3,4,5-trisphosphate 3-phosphatase/dual-specificity protein phosphatase PTEN
MDWLRKIVSGNRRRFNDKKYDLDITYITKRVLAMSFPASGIE